MVPDSCRSQGTIVALVAVILMFEGEAGHFVMGEDSQNRTGRELSMDSAVVVTRTDEARKQQFGFRSLCRLQFDYSSVSYLHCIHNS